MSSVIFKAINSYTMLPPRCNPKWAIILDEIIINDTRTYVENKGLHLQVLAELISQTMHETQEDPTLIKNVLIAKLEDENLIDKIAKEYNVRAYP